MGARDGTNLLIIANYLYQQTNDPTYLEKALTITDATRSLNANFWIKTRAALRRHPDLSPLIRRFQAAAEQMQNPAPEDDLAAVFAHIDAYEELKEEVTERLQEVAPEVFEVPIFDLAAVQEKMAADTSAIVGFYQNENVLYRVFIDRDTTDVAILNDDRETIYQLSEELATLVANPKAKSGQVGKSRQLYQLLFRGIDSLLPDRLSIIADGVLQAIPYNALRRDPSGTTPRYLGAEIALNRQLSVSTMLALERLDLDPSAKSPLGLAPTFASEGVQFAKLRQVGYVLPPLYYSNQELDFLDELGGGQFFYGEDATLDNYRERVGHHTLIHLATHAISSTDDGLRSRIYLMDRDGEPGSLYASEVGDQTLNADLVTLSACETGSGGSHFSEGRVGLTRAYLTAGARAVVSSNWAVDDQATTELMEHFYAALSTGTTPDRALLAARQRYIATHPDTDPYYWAAFAAYGGMLPVRWEAEADLAWVWWLLGTVGLLVIGGGVYARRSRKASTYS